MPWGRRQSPVELTGRAEPVAILLSIQEYQRLLAKDTRFWDAYTTFRMMQLGIAPNVFQHARFWAWSRAGLVTLTYLLDTTIISEPLRPVPNATILAYMSATKLFGTSLWFKCSRLPVSARRTAIEIYLTTVVAPAIPILAYAQRAAEWHAIERTRLVGIGKTPLFADGQIAATAVVNDLMLITLNRDNVILRVGAHWTLPDSAALPSPQAARGSSRRAIQQRPLTRAETIPQSDHARNVQIPAVERIVHFKGFRSMIG